MRRLGEKIFRNSRASIFFVGNNRCLQKGGKNLTERPLLLFAGSSQDSKTDSQQTPKSCAHTREEEERKKWVREIVVSSRRPSFRGKIHALTYFFSEQTQGKRERKKEIGMCGLNRRKEGKSEYVTCQCHLSLLGFDADFISILLPGFGCLKARLPSSHFPNLKEGRKMTPPRLPTQRGPKREGEFHCNDPEIRSLWLSLCFDRRQSKSDKKGKKIFGVGFRNFFATLFAPRPKEIHNIDKKEEAEPLTVSRCNCLLTFMLNKL